MVKTFFNRIICGFFLGLSTFAPGFSGSVVAISMGVYHDLVKIASNPVTEIRRQIRFLIPLGIGALISLVLFVRVFGILFEQYERATLLLFVGLIAGNLPVIGRQLKGHGLQKRDIGGGAVSFAIAVGLGILAIGTGHITGSTEGVHFLGAAMGGFLAGAVAFIPGMSISAILIVTGVFGPILVMMESVVMLQTTYLPHVLVLVLSVVLGLVLTARGIKRVFDRVPIFANACVFGFMSGTLIGIFIESVYIYDPYFSWWLGAVMLLLGVGLSLLFILLGKRMSPGAE